MRYCPEPSVTSVRIFSIRAGLAASTVTPGSTAPDVSLTVPVNEAWANANAGSRTTHASTHTTRADRRITHLHREPVSRPACCDVVPAKASVTGRLLQISGRL